MKVLDCEFIRVMEIRLKYRDNKMDSNLIAFYDISEQFLPQKGILQSLNSEIENKSETTSIRICYSCNSILLKPSRNDHPLKFSIANGFAIGILPSDLKDATYPETWLTSLSSINTAIYTVYGGTHQVLRLHATGFLSDP